MDHDRRHKSGVVVFASEAVPPASKRPPTSAVDVIGVSDAGASGALDAVAPPLPASSRIVRRYARWSVTIAVKTEMNGHPVTLVDVSTNGAQVASSAAIRTTQRVQVQFEGSVRIAAKVVWVAFEVRRTARRYRAGLEFLHVDHHELHALFSRLGLPVSAPTRS